MHKYKEKRTTNNEFASTNKKKKLVSVFLFLKDVHYISLFNILIVPHYLRKYVVYYIPYLTIPYKLS